MPKKPKRPCSHPGCPALTEDRYCDAHQKLADQQYEKYQRDPQAKKRYGRAWQKIRDSYIAAHPLCAVCQQHGHLTPTQEVHHTVPLSAGGTHDPKNLMALCKPCHSRITATEGGRWG